MRAWGWEGHIIVARIAEAHLTDKAKAGIAQRNRTKKIEDTSVASWPDNIRRDRPGPALGITWTFPLKPPVTTRAVIARTGNASWRNSRHFAAVLAATNATTVSKAEALRFVVHFVGDMHQPLHCIERNHDKGEQPGKDHLPLGVPSGQPA